MPRDLSLWVALGVLGVMLQAVDAAVDMPRWLLGATLAIWAAVFLYLVLRRRAR